MPCACARARICATDLDARRQTLVDLIEHLRLAADDGRNALETRLRERIDELRLELPVDRR